MNTQSLTEMRELVFAFARAAALILVLISHPGCVATEGARPATEEAVSEESKALDVAADYFATDTKRRGLEGKRIRFVAYNTSTDDPDKKSGFILGGIGEREVYLALISVANQKEAREFVRESGRTIVVEGIYSSCDASLVDGAHPFGMLQKARLLKILP